MAAGEHRQPRRIHGQGETKVHAHRPWARRQHQRDSVSQLEFDVRAQISHHLDHWTPVDVEGHAPQ
jgi:hypothetical protein